MCYSIERFSFVGAFVTRSMDCFTAHAESEQFRAQRLLCIEFCRLSSQLVSATRPCLVRSRSEQCAVHPSLLHYVEVVTKLRLAPSPQIQCALCGTCAAACEEDAGRGLVHEVRNRQVCRADTDTRESCLLEGGV